MNAPDKIPGKLYDQYTMGGEVPIEYKYANDCSDEIQELINKNYTKEIFDESVERIKRQEQNYYGATDTWLYYALEKYPVRGKDVCIIGSTHPWYEAMMITYGAKSCTVIEYSPRISFHENVLYKQPHEIGDEKYDICISISSYEHDGLGRYGDPLDPDGDLKAMQKTKTFVKKDGLLYLSVPIGSGKVVFNLHRVYGKKRFDMLIEGWEKVDDFGFDLKETWDNDYNGIYGSPYQPIAILKNT